MTETMTAKAKMMKARTTMRGLTVTMAKAGCTYLIMAVMAAKMATVAKICHLRSVRYKKSRSVKKAKGIKSAM